MTETGDVDIADQDGKATATGTPTGTATPTDTFTPGPTHPPDINNDGVIDSKDLIILMEQQGNVIE